MATVPDPLYVELRLLTLATWRILQAAKTHYAQTQPTALGALVWRIDAKDKKPTEYELLWTDVVKPLHQTMSLENGLISVADPRFDYSALAPFENPVKEKMPPHLAKANPPLYDGGVFRPLDIRKIFADLRFDDSKTNPGLQLVDIVASAYRRALTGTLGERGWRRLGNLMIRDFRGTAVSYVTMKPKSKQTLTYAAPYARAADLLESQARHWEIKPPNPPRGG